MENQKFDVFIAYHGNSSASEQRARELYEYLKRRNIYPNRAIRPYFHPATNPYGRFEDTPLIVARTPMFLLVVDKNIKRTMDGQLLRQREDGFLSNIYEEVRTFHDSPMYKRPGGDTASKVFITDDFTFKEAECLHPMFSGRTALNTKEAVAEWIAYFYQNTYIDRLRNQYKNMAENERDAFGRGEWVSEAEEIWHYTHDEAIGRALMIFYMIQVNSRTTLPAQRVRLVHKLRDMYDVYDTFDKLEMPTQKLLQMVRNEVL